MAHISEKSLLVPVKKQNKKRLPIWAKFIISIILLVTIFVIGVYIFINVKLNKIGYLEVFETIPPNQEYFEKDIVETTASDISESNIIIAPSPPSPPSSPSSPSSPSLSSSTSPTSPASDKSEITWPVDGEVQQDKGIINILLIGQDRNPGEARARSDSMMIATINKKNKTIKITSLMRDLYVQIPGYSDNRINAAYAFGGMNLLDETIEKNFQVHIDGNIEVDFDRFQKVINKIGEIVISINAAEAAYLTEQGFKGLSEGKVQMNGSLALEYSRIRYVGNSDFERTERQKLVMITEFNNIKGLGLPKILGLVDEVFPLVTTDLSNGQMISLATSVVRMGVDNVETFRIPVDGAFTSNRIRGMSVLVPDLEENRDALKNIIYGQ